MAEFTPAQKSAITRSAKAQKQRLDDIAFVSKNCEYFPYSRFWIPGHRLVSSVPPRKAKQTAKKNASMSYNPWKWMKLDSH
jgi:hypothetical protein